MSNILPMYEDSPVEGGPARRKVVHATFLALYFYDPLSYDEDDSEKFKAPDGDDPFGEILNQLVANDGKALPEET